MGFINYIFDGMQKAYDFERRHHVISNYILPAADFIAPELAPVITPALLGAEAVVDAVDIHKENNFSDYANAAYKSAESTVEHTFGGAFNTDVFRHFNLHNDHDRKSEKLMNEVEKVAGRLLPSATGGAAITRQDQNYSHKDAFTSYYYGDRGHSDGSNVQKKQTKTLQNSFPSSYNTNVSHHPMAVPHAFVEGVPRADLYHNPNVLESGQVPAGEHGLNAKHIKNNRLDVSMLPESSVNTMRTESQEGSGSMKRKRGESAPMDAPVPALKIRRAFE
jgi:hypothetical protein